MGKALKPTPEAALWAWALTLSCLFAGAAYAILLFTPIKERLFALIVSTAIATGCYAVMRYSGRLSDTLLGQYVWTFTVWLAAEDAEERAAYIEQLHEDGDST